MKKRIVNISVRQSANVVGALYLVVTFPIMLIGVLYGLGTGKGLGAFVLLSLSVGYAIVGDIGAAFFVWLYNFVAKRVGGFEYTTAEVSDVH